ncbi:MAG: serine/threonine-protein kinase [Planctomycetaceae bacterium]|jgi:eukaryotic-like serine/threonine-protein kinase|nr:serine/threonine-protein kinase [Planctomycetaceae bacterium]
MDGTPPNCDDDIASLKLKIVRLFSDLELVTDADIKLLIDAHNAKNARQIELSYLSALIARSRALHMSYSFPDWIPKRYRCIREIGAGATSHVYLAKDRQVELDVAIKIIKPGESLERFERESKLLQQLESKHIVRQLAFFDNGDQSHAEAAIVMEYIKGRYLSDVILSNKETPHSILDGITWMRQVCQAMVAAAECGIVHRDIKPANLIVAAVDNSIKLLDFGLAIAVPNGERSATGRSLTKAGEILGTPYYMSPEQSFDSTIVDLRNDVYSFGATFYHLLTGTLPFVGRDWIEVVTAHRVEILESPRSRNPDIDKNVANIIERCMAKQARDRFSNFSEILDELPASSISATVCEEVALDDHDDCPPPSVMKKSYSIVMPSELRFSEGKMSVAPPERKIPVSTIWGEECVQTFGDGRKLLLLEGDIVKRAEGCEVLVSSDDEMLSMAGGVAGKIKESAGGEYFQATRHLAPVLPGRVIPSGTGALSHRFVFHAVTIAERGAADGKRRIVPTPDLIRSILGDCFYHAQSLGVRSIAFPLLGTGNAGMDPEVCLNTMVEYISRELESGMTPLHEIRIIVLP